MRHTSLSVLAIAGLLIAATGCGGGSGDDAALATTTTEPATRDTSPIFTEDTIGSGEIVGTADTEINDDSVATPTAASGPTTSPPTGGATTIATGPPTTVGSGVSPTTAAATGATTTVASTPGTGDFVVGAGTADISGIVEETTEVYARSGASGEVIVPMNRILNIFLLGPYGWDFDEDPGEDVMELVDILDVDDEDDDDPFPEEGGAVIITLRPLTAGSTTLRLIDLDERGQPITIRVNAV